MVLSLQENAYMPHMYKVCVHLGEGSGVSQIFCGPRLRTSGLEWKIIGPSPQCWEIPTLNVVSLKVCPEFHLYQNYLGCLFKNAGSQDSLKASELKDLLDLGINTFELFPQVIFNVP